MNFFLFVLRLLGIRNHRTFRLVIRAFTLVIGLIVGFFVGVKIQLEEFDVGFWLYLIVIATAFLEFVLADVLADQSFPFDTERKLALMEKRLGADAIEMISKRLLDTIQKFRGCDKSYVSATVHVIAELNATNDSRTRKGLLQLTDYVGLAAGGKKKGRVTLINQGIIGRCARTEQCESVNFADATEYNNSMVREFGFTKSETKQHSASARSYLAYPLMNDNILIGVIYFFTIEPQVFPRAAEDANLDILAKEIVNYLKLVQLT